MRIVQAILLLIMYNIYTDAFIRSLPCISLKKSITSNKLDNRNQNYNEKLIYINYLIGLRKIRKTFKTTNIGDLVTVVNLTNSLMSNMTLNVNNSDINIDNEEINANKIIISNIHIDVSNVKYVHISTKNDTLIVELDKKNKLNDNILSDISNIDTLINILSMLVKVVNIN